jgi:hypothetical protein
MNKEEGCLPQTQESCDKKDFSHQFCDGTPGAIPLLCLASEMFPEMRGRLLSAAIRAGDNVWKKGLLLKGNSLCHGTAGNGFMLHSLYRTIKEIATKSEDQYKKNMYTRISNKWRTRAFMFAKSICDPNIQKK